MPPVTTTLAIMWYHSSEAPLQASAQMAVEPPERKADRKHPNLAKLNVREIILLCLQTENLLNSVVE